MEQQLRQEMLKREIAELKKEVESLKAIIVKLQETGLDSNHIVNSVVTGAEATRMSNNSIVNSTVTIRRG